MKLFFYCQLDQSNNKIMISEIRLHKTEISEIIQQYKLEHGKDETIRSESCPRY